MRFLISLFFIYASIALSAQETKSWRVLNLESGESIAFVNVLIDGGRKGTSTDIDGKFQLATSGYDSLRFSAIGYKTKRISRIQLLKDQAVYLIPNAYGLEEVIILPGVNPAHRLIDLAIENRKINNPELASEFYYESYNKLVFTGVLDSSIQNMPDSVLQNDSNLLDAKAFFDRQHVFIMESVTERNHMPPSLSKEVVTASRVSGLKNPIFSLIGTQLQSFSLYSTYITLFDANYLSPISKGSTNKYVFELRDTLLQGTDTVFTIYFRPRKGKFFTGLKGSISINTNGYAVQNFIAEPYGEVALPVKIQQKYELIDGKQWFPVQLNTTIFFANEDFDELEFLGIGKSYLKNIELKSRISKREIGNTVLKMDNDAGKKQASFWDQYRQDTLDRKEKETYVFMDSIGEVYNFDRKLAIYKTLFKGSFPVGPFDFPLNKIIGYNGYEGLRLGLGVETNDRLLPWFHVGGYGAYGINDDKWKYGYHGRWTPQSNRAFEVKGSYQNDVVESGGIQLFNDKISGFSSEAIQTFYIQEMDASERIQGEVSFRALRDFQFTFFANQDQRKINFEYRFDQGNSVEMEQFVLAQAGMNIRYSFREQYAEMFDVRVPVSSKYPVVFAKYTRGLAGTFDGDFEFNRVDLKIDQQILVRNLGRTRIRVAAGAVDEVIPITALYRGRGTNEGKVPIASDFSLETVGANEFFSSQYANFFFRHSFHNLLFNYKSFKPEIVLLSTVAFGQLDGEERHLNQEYKTMEKGLFESGLQINRIFDSIGIGAFYRYGFYALPDWEDNLAIKISSVISF